MVLTLGGVSGLYKFTFEVSRGSRCRAAICMHCRCIGIGHRCREETMQNSRNIHVVEYLAGFIPVPIMCNDMNCCLTYHWEALFIL
jgi:hypothetical protein